MIQQSNVNAWWWFTLSRAIKLYFKSDNPGVPVVTYFSLTVEWDTVDWYLYSVIVVIMTTMDTVDIALLHLKVFFCWIGF